MNYLAVIFMVIAVVICIIVFAHDPYVDYQKSQKNADDWDQAHRNQIAGIKSCYDLEPDIVEGSGHWLHTENRFYSDMAKRWNELNCTKQFNGVTP